MSQKYVVLCDFDGTISDQDSLNPIYRQYATCGTKFAEQWERGEVGTREEMIETFQCIHASRAQMENALDEINLDAGLMDLLAFCNRERLPFVILSDGLEWYIRYLLGKAGVEDVPVYANQIRFLSDGGFAFEFPWFSPENPRRGLHKPAIVKKYQSEGYRTIFIGNGGSDEDAVWKADAVFAKEPLYSYCVIHGIQAKHFESMTELADCWKKNPPHFG